MFDPSVQYRAAIMRGKSLTQMDDLLALYANILNELCPISEEDFHYRFNEALRERFADATKKTLDNHRTEIAGKLFGMYWVDGDGIVNISPRTVKLIEDGDQPAFFKDFCGKIQFPSPAQKSQTYLAQIADGICIHPCQFSLLVMIEIEKNKVYITKDELAYYVLNSKQVLQGKISPIDVAKRILSDRNLGCSNTIQIVKNYAFSWQHINELISYMIIANLIEKDANTSKIRINKKEMRSINALLNGFNLGVVGFDLSAYDVNSVDGRRQLTLDWDRYYAQPSIQDLSLLNTDIRALVPKEDLPLTKQEIDQMDEDLVWGVAGNTTELGSQGEEFVYRLERNRISNIFPRLVKHVINMSATKGIGYDIQSILGTGNIPEEKIFIEVKSTRRYSPVIHSEAYSDSVTITRNEWVAANQYADSYRLYRVYFSKTKVQIFEIKNPINLSADSSKVRISPLTYRVDFSDSSGSFIYDA